MYLALFHRTITTCSRFKQCYTIINFDQGKYGGLAPREEQYSPRQNFFRTTVSFIKMGIFFNKNMSVP